MCRPLGATRNGYLDLSDFDKMHRLMSTVASHTGHISRKEEVNWCIGNFLSDRPYMCCLAIPICSIEDQCYRSALLCSQTYITGILDGIIKPHRLKDDLKSPMYSVASPWMGRSFGSSGGKTGAGSGGFPGTPVSSFGAWCEQSRRKRKLYSIGTTVFVGRPDLKIPNRPHRGQLSCLVLSSTWPESTLPGQSKNEADEAYDYCRVAGYHERHILETADYRCAICSEAVPARSLVHRPIAYVRTGKKALGEGILRWALMRLAQYVKGKWNHTDLNAFFGSKSDAQIFDVAVPICESKSICEEVARTASREFIKLFLPDNIRLAFSGLDPDADLSLLEFEDDFSYCEQDSPELHLRKIGHRALMSAKGDRNEDPMDCALTITKLRRWYELCFEQEVAKREYLKQIGYRRTGDVSDSDSDGDESDVDESVVWVYARDDTTTTDPSSSRSSGSNRAARQAQVEREAVVRRLANQVLFLPLLDFEFWLLCEAVGGVEGFDGDEASEDSGSTITTIADVSQD